MAVEQIVVLGNQPSVGQSAGLGGLEFEWLDVAFMGMGQLLGTGDRSLPL